MEVKQIKAYFCKSELGTEPVRDWLLSLDISDRKVIGYLIKTVEYDYPIGMPITK